MSEWWTYRLSDFLLFAPRTYHRLFELYNAQVWPAHVLALGVGLGIVILAWGDSGRGRSRTVQQHLGQDTESVAAPGSRPHLPPWRLRWAATLALVLMAACWLWVAWAFHLQRFATINWAATGYAWAFGIQAGLLLWKAGATAVASGRGKRACIGVERSRRPSPRGAMGLALGMFALLLQPWVGVFFGRSWREAEVFGLAPDPTAIATLGLLLILGSNEALGERTSTPLRRALNGLAWPIPLAWCVVSGATLWTMGAPQAWLMPSAALLAVMAGLRLR